jgi:hypothetical protein
MQTIEDNILEQIDTRRDLIADIARSYLEKLHFDFPEVQFLTLTTKHRYGTSTLRVYRKKDSVKETTNTDDSLIENPFA